MIRYFNLQKTYEYCVGGQQASINRPLPRPSISSYNKKGKQGGKHGPSVT